MLAFTTYEKKRDNTRKWHLAVFGRGRAGDWRFLPDGQHRDRFDIPTC